MSPGPSIGADAARQTVTFMLPVASLGKPAQLSDAGVFVTTWYWASIDGPSTATVSRAAKEGRCRGACP